MTGSNLSEWTLNSLMPTRLYDEYNIKFVFLFYWSYNKNLKFFNIFVKNLVLNFNFWIDITDHIAVISDP